MFTDNTTQELALILGEKLLKTGAIAATAESCTGGGVAYAITEISGSSQWFDRSFITYSNEAKMDMLGVTLETLTEHGAVSEEVVQQMAQGAVENSNANIAVSISGIAGPDGGTEEKPVGTVCLSWYQNTEKNKRGTYLFQGNRQEVRVHSIRLALIGLIELLEND